MKILLAVNDRSMNSKIAKRFGHANYYLIYDRDSKNLDVRVNSGHDEEHSGLVDLINEGVTNFIVGNIGPIAFRILNDKNAKVYLARDCRAQDALDMFLNNELEELKNPTLKRSIERHS
jgi:predicted Fe-Mo cluster-binding NifX family protein